MLKLETDRTLFAADMAGTLLFAMEGATAAITGNLDLLGLMVLAFATALGGGIVRDILIGDTPPAALRDWHYAALAFSGAFLVFFLHHFVQEIPANLLIVLDAVGLSLFAIAGTQKALLHKMHPFIAVLLGTITAVGGGTIRDLFLARTPRVLEADVYATAALAGSLVMILLCKLRLAPALAGFTGGVVCFFLRVVSVWQHWNLPKVRGN
jgi:uncharacterized membrane protein YeiH